LKALKLDPLENEIHMRGAGSHIYNDLRKPNGLAIETLVEFIIVEGMGGVLCEFIFKQYGQFEIIEHF
jgi:ATP-binding cassette subfamily A (ABC1) protein 3